MVIIRDDTAVRQERDISRQLETVKRHHCSDNQVDTRAHFRRAVHDSQGTLSNGLLPFCGTGDIRI